MLSHVSATFRVVSFIGSAIFWTKHHEFQSDAKTNINKLVVSTHLQNIRQNGNLPQGSGSKLPPPSHVSFGDPYIGLYISSWVITTILYIKQPTKSTKEQCGAEILMILARDIRNPPVIPNVRIGVFLKP